MFILHQHSRWQRKVCLLTGSKRESTSDHGPVYMEELPDRALPRQALYMGAVASLAPSAAALQASQTDVLQTQVNCLTVLSLSCMLSSICGTVWRFYCTCAVLCCACLGARTRPSIKKAFRAWMISGSMKSGMASGFAPASNHVQCCTVHF